VLFNSIDYFLFFSIVLIAFRSNFGSQNARLFFLLICSYYFYASNNGWLLLLILTSTIIDYYAALKIESSRDKGTKKNYLILSIAANLTILCFFKYFNFFGEAVVNFFKLFDHDASWDPLAIALPVGISFYTFQSMSYTIDVYRGTLSAEKRLLNVALYVSFFPQLVAGPIVRAKNFLWQLQEARIVGIRTTEAACFLIIMGLFKKIVLGDYLGVYVDDIYSSPADFSSLEILTAAYAFSFQIYFDFSGYSDIAIGSAMLLGFRIPPNFKRPYAAVSITEFWRRWHMSLSFWLRDYLFKPLGGTRMATTSGGYRNIIITMLLGGLWHGASWNFVFWGGLVGALLTLEKLAYQAKLSADFLGKPFKRFLRAFLLFNVITFTWIPFRVDSMGDLATILSGIAALDLPNSVSLNVILIMITIVLSWAAMLLFNAFSLKKIILKLPSTLRISSYGAAWCALIIFGSRDVTPFIYFKF